MPIRANRFGKFLEGASGPITGTAIGLAASMAMGDSFGSALQSSITDYVGWAAAPNVMAAKMVYDIATPLGVGIYNKYKWDQAAWSQTYKHNMGGNGWRETQGSLTMRQRAVQAIQESKMNARSVLGREASLMHQGMGTPPQMRSQRMGW